MPSIGPREFRAVALLVRPAQYGVQQHIDSGQGVVELYMLGLPRRGNRINEPIRKQRDHIH